MNTELCNKLLKSIKNLRPATRDSSVQITDAPHTVLKPIVMAICTSHGTIIMHFILIRFVVTIKHERPHA